MEIQKEYILYISPTHVNKIMQNNGLEELEQKHSKIDQPWKAELVNGEIKVSPRRSRVKTI